MGKLRDRKVILQIILGVILAFTLFVPIHEAGHYLAFTVFAPQCEIIDVVPFQFELGNPVLGLVEYQCPEDLPISTLTLVLISGGLATFGVTLLLMRVLNNRRRFKYLFGAILAISVATMIWEISIPPITSILGLIAAIVVFFITTKVSNK